MARTQEQRKAETRALLLDAAADLFARKGFHAVSAEAVAEAADRTTGALYAHFGSKDGLLLALVEQWIAVTADRVLAGVVAADDLRGRLEALWDDTIAFDPEHTDAWLLLEFELWLHAARDPATAVLLAERYAGLRDRMAGALEAWAADAKIVLRQPADDTATLVIGLLFGLVMQHHIDSSAINRDVVVSGLMTLLTGAPE